MKRIFDIFFSLTALVLVSPVLITVSILNLIIMGRPIFFIQKRLGYKNSEFPLFKFRTMSCDESADESARIGKWGAFLRKCSIDELPGFLNILMGDMSVVGPRPLLVEYKEFYSEEQIKRHSVRPGLTGLAQVSGRNALSWSKKFKLDLEYLEKSSLVFDIKLIFKTISQVVFPKGINSSASLSMERFDNPLIVYGGGGHSLSVQMCLEENDADVYAIYDRNINAIKPIPFYQDALKIDDLSKFKTFRSVIAIGDNKIRKLIAENHNATWQSFIHPSAIVHESAVIGDGSVVLAGAYVGPNSVIGDHVIVNTYSVVEHDCKIGSFSHIAPNSTLCGGVEVGELCLIGAGSTIRPVTTICSEVVIGINSAVVKNINKPGSYAGAPAKGLNMKKEMNMNISMAKPIIDESDINGVVDVLKSGVLSLGPVINEFEENIKSYVGCREAVAVSSGTSALHLILLAMGVGEGDEVIVPSYTFVSSVSVILHVGAVPVFADIEKDTYCICPKDMESKITERTKAILGVDIFGHPADWETICKIAKKYNLRTIDDSCEALGSAYKGKKVGTFADASAFAFYPNKQITTGEGGMVVTDDTVLAQRIRAFRNQGRSEMGGWLKHHFLGYNCRMNELSASLGVTQLKKIDYIMSTRENVAMMYNQRLETSKGLKVQHIAKDVEMSWFVYVIHLNGDLDRDTVINKLAERNIPARAYFDAIHEQPFIENYKCVISDLPNTNVISKRTLALPFHSDLTQEEVNHVCDNLLEIIAELNAESTSANMAAS